MAQDDTLRVQLVEIYPKSVTSVILAIFI